MSDALEPVKIFPQRCFRCDREMLTGETAYAHVVNPVAVCVQCYEKSKPESRATMAKAMVSE
jgi:formylmethanofuran dehydrogenase subunit E